MALKRDTRLVQRLLKLTGTSMVEPKERWKLEKDGNLPMNAATVRSAIYEYDYMGAAEFEYGIIPKVVKALVQDKLIAFSIDCTCKWQEFGKQPEARITGATGVIEDRDGNRHKTLPIHILCRDQDSADVEERVRLLLTTPRPKLKEDMRKKEAFGATERGEKHRVIGWLELDNGFYFFSQKKQWQYTTKLFTGEVPL